LKIKYLLLPKHLKGDEKIIHILDNFEKILYNSELYVDIIEFDGDRIIINNEHTIESTSDDLKIKNFLKVIEDLHTIKKKLKISNIQLLDLPKSIGNLTSLEILDLSSNNFSILPKCIERLSSLKKLKLSHNNIKKLSESIENFSSLEILILNSKYH